MYHIVLLLLVYCGKGQNGNGESFGLSIPAVDLDEGMDYGFVIDAGSTGSRLYGFQWEPRETSSYPPPESEPVRVGTTLKVGPVSSITSLQSAYDLLVPLIDHAISILRDGSVSEERWSDFPVYLKATAGLRMLETEHRMEIFDWIRDVFRDETVNPFLYDDSYVIIAAGVEEATFDWLSVNYLLNTLRDGSEYETYGSLDLGGASTQIAFTPLRSYDIIDEFMFTKQYNHPWRLYAISHLGYGKNEVERQIAAKVYMEGGNKNPCLLRNTTKTYDFIRVNYTKIYNVTQIGVADSKIKLCEQYLHDILYLDEHECLFDGGRECSINGQYLPQIPPNMSWVAFDNFGEKIADTPGVYENSTIKEIYDVAVNNICMMTLDELIAKLPEIKEPEKLCIMDLYIVVLLRDGYGFDVNKRNILWSNTINKEPAGWQWGSILYDANLLPYKINCDSSDSSSSDSSSSAQDDQRGWDITDGLSTIYQYGFNINTILLGFILVSIMSFLCIYYKSTDPAQFKKQTHYDI